MREGMLMEWLGTNGTGKSARGGRAAGMAAVALLGAVCQRRMRCGVAVWCMNAVTVDFDGAKWTLQRTKAHETAQPTGPKTVS